jgi:hypothetical protein
MTCLVHVREHGPIYRDWPEDDKMGNTGAVIVPVASPNLTGVACFIDFLFKRLEESCHATPHRHRATHSHPSSPLVENGDTGTIYTTLVVL